jgi:hypothetical protein
MIPSFSHKKMEETDLQSYSKMEDLGDNAETRSQFNQIISNAKSSLLLLVIADQR